MTLLFCSSALLYGVLIRLINQFNHHEHNCIETKRNNKKLNEIMMLSMLIE